MSHISILNVVLKNGLPTSIRNPTSLLRNYIHLVYTMLTMCSFVNKCSRIVLIA